jgi:putative ABC transport system permease protein
MDKILFEIRYAARRLMHSPGFSLVVLLTLALGIGANTAIFSVVNTVLLQPLPYREPERLATINHVYPALKLQTGVSAIGFRDYRDRTHSFDGVAVQMDWPVNLTGAGDPERLNGMRVSGQWFRVLGITPALGRTILDDDDQPGKEHVVVISDGLWRRIFGARREVLERQVALNGESYDVIGVMPAAFVDPGDPSAELWSPIAFKPAIFVPSNYTSEFLDLTARIKPGVTPDQAGREMSAFAEALKKQYPEQFSPDWTLTVVPLASVTTATIRPALLVLLGAVGFVLLIACANVANLLLARAAARQKEVAIRTALGARPWDLIRQLVTESLLLSVTGGVIGLGLAWWTVRAVVAFNPANLPRVHELTIDGTVIAFTFGIAVFTGLIFGLVPALQSWRANLHRALKDGGRGGTADHRQHLVRRGLVVAEVALALTLLTGSGLLIKSFARLAAVDPGFNPANVLTFTASLPAAKYATATAKRQYWAAVVPRLAQVPGVVGAGATTNMPFSPGFETGSFNVEGYTPPANGNGPWGDLRIVSPEFHRTIGIPLIAGRLLEPGDDEHAPWAAVVDDEFVRRYCKPGTDAIGKRIWFGGPATDSTRYITIVGVVGHAKHERLDADARTQVYFPIAQGWFAPVTMDIAVRTRGAPSSATSALRAALHEVDADIPMARVRTLQDLVDASMGQRRLSAILIGVFAGIALLLASIGIYGVMSYTVARRTRELGLRVALGAPRAGVLSLVLRQGAGLVAIGVGIGLAGAFGLSKLIASQLYSVTPTDPVTFASVTGLLAAVAVGATLIPALRATRIDPIVALREE